MLNRVRSTVFVVLFIMMTAFGTVFAGEASADSAGTVHFVRAANSSFDQFTSSPSLEAQEWLSAHMWRMVVWSPYFDDKTSWYPNGWVYDDSYAIYRESQLTGQHPEWILKDTAGNRLYIPYGCSEGTCPQYAADISNPAYRQYWINNLKAEVAHGYKGVFVDDVNMEMKVGNGQEERLAPIDPSTGRPMTEDAWRGYMAHFMAEIREALPGVEIVHNAIWFADGDAGTANPDIKNEISAANYISLERGVNDSGLTGGDGPWSLNAFLAFIDQVHALGKGVVLDGTSSNTPAMEYNLASYFLVSTGNDAVSGGGQTPANWWAGWNVSLGEATSTRHTWNNLLRRDFTGGMALVNPPGAPTLTVSLPNPMQDVNGNTITSVTLPAASGAILRGAKPSTSVASESPAPTQTTVETTVLTPTPSPGSGSASGNSGILRPPTSTTPAPPTTTKPTTPSGHKRTRYKQNQRAHQANRRGSRRARHRAVLTRVSGVVLQATRGKVTIQIEARRGRRWVDVRRLTVELSSVGRFVRSLHMRAGAHYRVRAVYDGAPGYRPSRSRYRQIVPSVR